MEKILSLLMAVLLVVAMAVPAFATEVDSYSGKWTFNDVLFLDEDNRYPIPFEFVCNGVTYSLITFQFWDSDNFWVLYSVPGVTSAVDMTKVYDHSNGGWVDDSYRFIDITSISSSSSSTRPLYDSSLSWFSSNAVRPVCDGTSCPATDANYDNVCDDCGNVLTYNLRSTTLDYARSLAQSKYSDGYPYYAIFLSGSTYIVHISKTPMTSPSGTDLDGSGIMYNRVSQSSDGVNGGSGWYNGFYQSYDEFVEANHSISNFLPAPPLAMEIQGVTEEQMTKLLPEMVGTMKTLALCGVGCLALLVVLKLFGKRSLIYRN